MKKIYTAHFYTPEGGKDSDVFVADSKNELEKQFLKYSKHAYGTVINETDIDNIIEIDEVSDEKGNIYKITNKKIIEKQKLIKK